MQVVRDQFTFLLNDLTEIENTFGCINLSKARLRFGAMQLSRFPNPRPLVQGSCCRLVSEFGIFGHLPTWYKSESEEEGHNR